jgi:hypothetical protein
MEDILFTCEICQKQFPADPETMLECRADFTLKDPVTGEDCPLPDDEQRAISEQMESDPEVAPFLKGAICVCHECQKRWEQEGITLN